MNELNRSVMDLPRYPERILQIGEGNFLRCFIGWQVDILNEKNGLNAGIVVARPIDTEVPPPLNVQDGLYTTLLRGYDEENQLRNEKRFVSSVNREISIYREYAAFLQLAHNPELRFVFSNTTEAGIAYSDQDRFEDAPPATYPAKLTRFLFERFEAFGGAKNKGFILFPCELLDYNGELLKEYVLKYAKLWNLSAAFIGWLEDANTFCSTLVDRIVTGYPRDEVAELEQELGYHDRFMVTGEYFHLFVIQAPQWVGEELKLADSGLHVEIVDDLKPYKQRKVGILNGCHTALTPVAWLCGIEFVKDATSDPQLENYLSQLLDKEIIPCLPLPVEELKPFADSVIGRFKNPFIKHKLLDISLNSMTKFRTRLLPQLLRYSQDNGTVPPLMSLALAALICFYRGELNCSSYPTKDDQPFLDMYRELWGEAGMGPIDLATATAIVNRVLSLDQHWEAELLKVDGLRDQVAGFIVSITGKGMRETLAEVL